MKRLRRSISQRLLPWLDLRAYPRSALPRDALAGVTVAVLGIPQGVAYALVAGLPPAMGLYTAVVPAIVGALFRSSRHVITGPTNAVSLLVGSIVASRTGDDPVTVGITLAAVVGAVQLLAGWLRLGALVDYISAPVLLGYITGAGTLIGAGQLKNLTGTEGSGGTLITQLRTWTSGLNATSLPTLALGLGTFALVLGLRRWFPRAPHAMLVMALGIVLSALLPLQQWGVATVGMLAPVPRGWPPWSLPDLGLAPSLLSGALACTLLSLVESSSVARTTAARTGDRLDMSTEFSGQGLANLVGGFFGSFPSSGSLARTALNTASGATSRLSGVISGAITLGVLLTLGPVVNLTPVATLAGLLLAIAGDLIDVGRIRLTLRATRSDIIAFVVTLGGTFTLPLDHAVELGVVISIVLFLRRARLLTVRELVRGDEGRLREAELGTHPTECRHTRILHVEGALFFGASGELQNTFESLLQDTELRVLVVRLKRAQGLDLSAALVLRTAAERLRTRGGQLVLVGMRQAEMNLLKQTGIAETIGTEALFPTEPGWFVAMERALAYAETQVPPRGKP